MSYSFSSHYWDSTEEELAEKINTLADKILDSNIAEYHIHKWRYSRPANFYNKRFEFIEQPGPLYLAGDSFLGNNLESAYLSGIEKYSYKLSERIVV